MIRQIFFTDFTNTFAIVGKTKIVRKEGKDHGTVKDSGSRR